MVTIQTLFPEPYRPYIWLVGGTVRDMLLGQSGQDTDLVASISPQTLKELGFRPVSPVSSTPIWFRNLPGAGKIEVTVIAEPSLLEQDLRRRDFTINALAMDCDGRLVDPLNGQADLAARQLRVCSEHSFLDDPIRIFRAFRFAADGWKLHAETDRQLKSRCWEQAFSTIPIERFSGELKKSLSRQYPNMLFQLMVNYQIGSTCLPELFQMSEVPAGPLQHHPEGDLLSHSLQVMQRVAAVTSDPLARFCGFFHDLGKLSTDPLLHPKHHGHDGAGFKPARSLCARLRLPAAWSMALAWTCRLHTKANNWDELRLSTRISLATQAVKAGIAEILPLVSSADKPGRSGMDGWEKVVQVISMTTAELGVDHETFMRMPVRHRANQILHKRIQRLRELKNVPRHPPA